MIKSDELDLICVNEPTNFSYLMLQNIKDGIIDKELPYIAEIKSQYDKYCLKTNDLLISKISPFKVCMIEVEKDKKILANGNLYFLEIDENKMNPKFVEAYLQSEGGIYQLNKLAKGSAIKNISIQDLKMIKIPDFEMNKQNKIANDYIALNEELDFISKKQEIIKEKKSSLFIEVMQ